MQYGPLLWQGALTTITAWLFAGILSLLIGTFLGVVSCRALNFSVLQWIVRIYTFIAKGIPAYVQILIAYFLIPHFLGIQVSGLAVAIGALAFCSGGYMAEIIRAGMNVISVGQWEACAVLGYPLPATLRRIILPQVFNNILPTVLGELEQLLKSTSLLSAIGVVELTRSGMNIISRELNPVPVYLLVALIYLGLSALLQGIAFYFEYNRERA